MTKPANPDWATSTNFSAGTYSGQTTKVTPAAATIAEGFNADAPLPVEWLNERINNHAKWIRWMDGAQRTNCLKATWMTPYSVAANVYYDGGFVTGKANTGTVTTSGGGGAVYDSPFMVGTVPADQDTAFCVTSRSLQIPSFFSGSLSFDIAMSNVGANNMTIFAGMATALTAGAGTSGALVAAASGIGFQRKSTDTNWRCLTANGATLTNTDSATAPTTAATNFRIDIVGDDGTASPAAYFYINDSLITTTVNTINTTANMFIWWQVSATAATANTASLGSIGCSWTRMSGY